MGSSSKRREARQRRIDFQVGLVGSGVPSFIKEAEKLQSTGNMVGWDQGASVKDSRAATRKDKAHYTMEAAQAEPPTVNLVPISRTQRFIVFIGVSRSTLVIIFELND